MKISHYIFIPLFLAILAVISFLFAPFLFSSLFADLREPEVEKKCGEIVLSWESVERAQSYVLYRDGEPIYSGRARSYVDRPLVLGDFHLYSLVAVNEGGRSDVSAENLIKTERPCPPEAPEKITVHESPCGGKVSLEWEPSREVDTYQLVRSPIPVLTGGIFAWMRENVVYEGDETAFEEDGLQPGGFYTYKVRAKNETGWSDWTSKFIRASKMCPPERPSPPTGNQF